MSHSLCCTLFKFSCLVFFYYFAILSKTNVCVLVEIEQEEKSRQNLLHYYFSCRILKDLHSFFHALDVWVVVTQFKDLHREE